MRLVLIVLLFAGMAACTADQDFNGRWDITVPGELRARAWCLEVRGAGTGELKGKFVGAPGPQMGEIKDLTIRDRELRFSFELQWHGTGSPRARGVWTARLLDGELRGGFSLEGRPALEWIGRRAPAITEHDDGTWREGQPVVLFNRKDLSGWRPIIPGRELGWTVKDRIMSNQGGANNLVSEKKSWNFLLHVAYRVEKGSNRGLGLRGRYDVQILADFGRPLSTHSNGALHSRIIPSVNASKPPGQWQTCDIWLVGRQVTAVLNGIKIIDHKEIEGLTAIATDPHEGQPGPISLQGDHGVVEFRSILVAPLSE